MYTRLTKTVTDNEGKSNIVCLQYGTNMCRIHNNNQGCINCPMYRAIIEQLAAFEDIMIETEEDKINKEE